MNKQIDTKLIEKDMNNLKNILFKNDTMQIIQSETFKQYAKSNILYAFCCQNGIYNIPTIELIDYLKEILPKNTLEIAAGNGVLAKNLGIKATDNLIQLDPVIALMYTTYGHGIPEYGKNVEKIEAIEACKKYNPDTVLASWTSDSKEYSLLLGQGIDEEYIIQHHNYVCIGNTETHKNKYILKYPHKTITNIPLVSKKGLNNNVIWIWNKQKI